MKMATSELRGALAELGMELQGPFSGAAGATAAEDGRWQHAWTIALAATIGGGTSEIQRNVIAQRVLGLPKG
jgi:alkylation response protein AidB-like acyl-CoA dehydrogenase